MESKGVAGRYHVPSYQPCTVLYKTIDNIFSSHTLQEAVILSWKCNFDQEIVACKLTGHSSKSLRYKN